MELRRLGRSGIIASPLGLGTARIAGLGWREDMIPPESSQAKQDAVWQVQAAVDLGITLFDTADNYGRGLSERILGEALRGRREGVIVATKFGEDPMPDQEDPWFLDANLVKQIRDIEQIHTLAQAQQYGPLPPDAMQAIAEWVKNG